MTNSYHLTSLSIVACLLSACAQNSLKSQLSRSVDVSRILEQVNRSVEAARLQTSVDAPLITSIRLDLQVSTAAKAEAGFPVFLIAPQGKIEENQLHRISLEFVPHPPAPLPSPPEPTVPSDDQLPSRDKDAVAARKPASEIGDRLTQAIVAITETVRNSNPNFKFQSGSVQIQCTLAQTAGVDSNATKLVPIDFTSTVTNQSTQGLTLYFGQAKAKDEGAPLVERPAPAPPSHRSPGSQRPAKDRAPTPEV